MLSGKRSVLLVMCLAYCVILTEPETLDHFFFNFSKVCAFWEEIFYLGFLTENKHFMYLKMEQMEPFSSPSRTAALKNLVNNWSVLLVMCLAYCVIWRNAFVHGIVLSIYC